MKTMKSIAVLLALSSGLTLYAVPAGATDLVPRSDSAAKEQTKIPEGDTTTTVTFSAEPATAKPSAENNNLFGNGNALLPAAVDKAKPYVLEILYGEVTKPIEPLFGGSSLVPSAEFHAQAKGMSISMAPSDQGKTSSDGATVVYHVEQAGSKNNTFWIYTIVSIPAVEKGELKTRLIINKDEWNVFGGPTKTLSNGSKRYFYWAIRINTQLNKFPPGSTDG